MIWPHRLAAQETIKVDVGVDLNVAAMTLLWPAAQLPVIHSTLQTRLTTHLQKAFPPWQFNNGKSGSPISLNFRLLERIPNEISLVLIMQRGTVPSGISELAAAVWMRPADVSLHGYPVAGEAAQRIADAFIRNLLEPQQLTLAERLRMNVPLAVGGQWVNGTPSSGDLQLVLPLLWERYQSLRSSIFMLACEWPGHGDAQLESAAPGLSASYKPSPPNSPFPALVVVPKWLLSQGGRTEIQAAQHGEVRQLQPRLVFLKEFREPLAWDIFSPQDFKP
jgi:hypothetical protein